eukprot:gene16394-11720_t
MPQIFLKIKAELENVKHLSPVRNNYWKFDIQTPQGGDERKGITVSEEDLMPLEGSRGEAHFIIKWPYTHEQAYIKIVNHRGVKSSYNEADSGEFVTILALECRNIEVTAWYPSEDFIVRTKNDTVFSKVDLSDRDWAEYDEEHDATVSVANLEYRFDTEA